MTEHDGLTAEQEAIRRYPPPLRFGKTETLSRREAFIEGAEWATEREKARAKAAEARVAELERALSALVDKIIGPDEGAEAWDELIDLADAGMRALTTPTTEAVTEVEGS